MILLIKNTAYAAVGAIVLEKPEKNKGMFLFGKFFLC
jgi:hypothetical protein